jgi:diadenosine tetraphosphate (Ap4A) HIT family hydrolase
MRREKILNLKNARVPHQEKQMKRILARGICPFCKKYFAEYHAASILKEGKYWFITKNDYPYEGSSQHWLLVHKKHIATVQEITKKGFEELGEFLSWVEKNFNIQGGSFVMRFGDINYTGATISHLHAHVVVGSRQTKKSVGIKVKVGFQK